MSVEETSIDTGNTALNAVSEYFSEEFPLLDDLSFGTSAKAATHCRMPHFFGYFLAAAFSPDKRPCCFVVPTLDDTPLIAAYLIAFYDIVNRFDEFLERYAQREFVPGSRVRVIANREVYEYEGFRVSGAQEFWLKELGSQYSRRNYKLEHIVRLEPTKYKVPKGKLGSMGKPELATIDELLGIQTFKNCSLFLNTVISVGTKKIFESFIAGSYFSKTGARKACHVESLLPWATINEDGTFRPDDRYLCAGEPAIAVSPRPFQISQACRASADYSKVLIVSEVERLIRNMSALDALLDTQKLIIFATQSQATELAILREKEVLVWELSRSDLAIGYNEQSELEEAAESFHILKASSRAAQQVVNLEIIEDSNFDHCANLLEEFKRALRGAEDRIQTVDAILRQLYHVLLDLSSFLNPPDQDTVELLQAKLQSCSTQLLQSKLFISESIADVATKCIDGLTELLRSDAVTKLSAKGQRADALLSDRKVARNSVLIARSAHGKTNVSAFAVSRHLPTQVIDPGEVTTNRFYELAIVAGWPNSNRWNKIIHTGISTTITLLCYGFESRWYSGYQRAAAYTRQQMQLSAEDKVSLLALPSELKLAFAEQQPVIEEAMLPDFSFSIESAFSHVRKDSLLNHEDKEKERRPAYYISFGGETYAYLTPSHSIPSLGDGMDSGDVAVQLVKAADLHVGELVLFRETGEGNVLKELAEQRIGVEEYGSIRTRAAAWRAPLQKIGNNPKEVAKFLAGQGLKKDWQTINNWLFAPDQIGPGSMEDIVQIGRITNNADLQENAEEIMEHILEIRRLHMLAGHKLTEMILAAIPGSWSGLSETETVLKLDIGTVWIVSIEYIEKPCGAYPAQYLNTLRWS